MPTPPPWPEAHRASPDWALDTAVVHLGRPRAKSGEPLNLPLEPASAYFAGGDIEYARDGTRAMRALEDSIGALEGGHGVVYSSGMAAAAAIMDTFPAGALIIATPHLYTGVAERLRQLHRHGRITLRIVDVDDPVAFLSALPGAHLVWLETPSNPMLDVHDIQAITKVAHEHRALVLCDNTFATPLGQRPLQLGADLVLHSATKFIGGHSDLMAGAIVTVDEEEATYLREQRVLLGSIPGVLECFLALRGLRTLSLRWQRAQSSAGELAQRLTAHPSIIRVRYPGLPTHPRRDIAERQMTGFGALISIETASAVAAQTLCESTRLWVHSTSLGGVESLLERRRRWPLESPRVPDALVRLSVGIEDVDDLWRDLDQALAQVPKP